MMEALYRIFLQYPRISTDTRNIIPDSIFVALKGENFDGNNYVLQALQAGARFAVTEDEKFAERADCLVVNNALETLQQLSLYHRKQIQHIPVIGITGTNGKTTTKELMAAVLAKKYKVSYTKGNLNNHIGVPLTLLSITPEDEIAIVEMGANHPGEIAELCELALPNYGVVTNIGTAHLEGFLSVENIIQTKTALYKSVMKRNGTIFANADDQTLVTALQDYPHVLYYARNSKATVQGEVLKMNPFLELSLFGEKIETNLTGDYNLYNMLCAAAVGRYFKVSDNEILNALAEYTPQNQRSQVIKKENVTVIADYYNANPTSMMAAIENLQKIDSAGKLAILGDMLELGEASRKEHQQIIYLCHQYGLEAFFVGKEFAEASETKENCFLTTEELDRYLESASLNGKMILIKGSRGIHLEKLKILTKHN